MYILIFCINNELQEFTVPNLDDATLHNTVTLFDDCPRIFLLNHTKTKGRLYYSFRKFIDFKVVQK